MAMQVAATTAAALCNFSGIRFSPRSAAQRGRLAQWLERSPHTGEVQGSSPWSPTTHLTVQFYHQSLDDAKRRRDRCVQKVLGLRRRVRLWAAWLGRPNSGRESSAISGAPIEM